MEESRTDNDRFVFSNTRMRTPIEELEEIFKKKFATFTQLGDEEKVRLYQMAHELARTHLTGGGD